MRVLISMSLQKNRAGNTLRITNAQPHRVGKTVPNMQVLAIAPNNLPPLTQPNKNFMFTNWEPLRPASCFQ